MLSVQLDVKRLLIPSKIIIKQLRSNMYQTEEESILFRIANGNLDVNVSNVIYPKIIIKIFLLYLKI
jgi:hypothetical protein